MLYEEEYSVEEITDAETEEENDSPELRDVQLLNPIFPEEEAIENTVDKVVKKSFAKGSCRDN